ncbi:MAG: DUF87 domain-containing protein [Gemmatimonadota bacterium]
MSEPKPGSLHLGGVIDEATGERGEESFLLRARDLTTHGVIIGMTGSGKTGLGVVMIEEALLQGIPVLTIDPKGDLGNLLLAFPELRGSDFAPWVDPAEAEREGVGVDELAAATAARWREGLAGWGIDGARLRALAGGSEVSLYTPGSGAGTPVNAVGSMAAPDLDWDEHGEVLRDEIAGIVSGLLVLIDVEPDPISSREHILLSNLIEHSWREGRDLDLATLIARIADPPIRRLGVFELDTFFPDRERQKLALRMNALLASPAFAEWLRGVPLDIDVMLGRSARGARASVMTIAHLSDAERQFFVTLLLAKVVTWIRRQPGTSDLRALIYLDEAFGFLPPTAAPPTKQPILTILKQARAHGVGMVISTQNPVDLDYKAMSNAGTWMIGRLQTERDKARVLEALRSASGGADVAELDERIGGLEKRRFLAHSTRSAAPRVFTTRWAMSYLRGPLTRDEIRSLREAGRGGPPEELAAAAASSAAAGGEDPGAASAGRGPGSTAADESEVPPVVVPTVPVRFLEPAAAWAGRVDAAAGATRLEPALAARVHLRFDERRAGVDHREEWEAIFFPIGERVRAEDALSVDYDEVDFRAEPPEGATYALSDAPLDDPAFFRRVRQELKDHLYRTRSVKVFRAEQLGLWSRVGESREDFDARADDAAQTLADDAAAKLRDRYEKRADAARKRLARSEQRARELEVDVEERSRQEWISGAGELLGMFLGGRRRTRGLTGVASRRSMTRRTRERLRSAQERLDAHEEDLDELEEELAQELIAIDAAWAAKAADVSEVSVDLEKTDISVDEIALVWVPVLG